MKRPAALVFVPVLAVALAGAMASSSGCRREPPLESSSRAGDEPFVRGNEKVQGHYSKEDGRLELITCDANGNGKIDTWSYMDLARVVRIEMDEDEDGRLDRWEHYGEDGKLEKVGFSRAGDGREDAWAHQGPDGTVARVEVLGKDDRVTRTEFYEGGTLARSVEDTNGDGRPDKWETFEGSRLASVAFDTDGDGEPDRRLVYAPDGTARVEGGSR